jgi:hypothetical protein
MPRVSILTAPLDAAYGVCVAPQLTLHGADADHFPGLAFNHDVSPPAIPGKAVWLTAITSFHFAGKSLNGWRRWIPALLTRTSMAVCSSIRAIAASISAFGHVKWGGHSADICRWLLNSGISTFLINIVNDQFCAVFPKARC